MIQITPHMRILVAVAPVDFRKGIDGLAALCRQVLSSDPLSGTLFVFCSRRRHAIKCLMYDGQGFWICQKRLSAGRFASWPQADASGSLRLDAHQLQLLLWNGDPGAKADTLFVHADVRRMLMEGKAFNEAARALILWGGLQVDLSRLATPAAHPIAHRRQRSARRPG